MTKPPSKRGRSRTPKIRSSPSSASMWRLKRESRKRSRELMASGQMPPETAFLVRPGMLKGARIEWPGPDVPLSDSPPEVLDYIEGSPREIQCAVLRSRGYHLIIANKIAADPSLREVVSNELKKLRIVNPHGTVYHDRWAALLAGPLDNLLHILREFSQAADTLRKESPCTVLVTAEEHHRVFESVGKA